MLGGLDAFLDARMDAWVDGWMVGWLDGWMVECWRGLTEGRMDGWMGFPMHLRMYKS